MKNAFGLIIILTLICFSGCESENPLTFEESKEVILEYSPGAEITSCTLSEDSENYIIEFSTSFDSYTGIVNVKTGEILSISVVENEEDDPASFENEDDSSENTDIPAPVNHSSALNIALNDAEPQGSAVVILNELDEEEKVYKIIFRSLNKEYTYEISAEDGSILHSASYIDS